MGSSPRVLLIDDGNLFRIRKILEGFDVELELLRGRVREEDLEGPFDLAITTVKQILEFEDVVDLTQLPGKPIWIAVHSQDFLPLRVRLRKMGVSYLVQTSVGSEALRLLVHHTLYSGPSHRDDSRLPIGTPVMCIDAAGASTRAELLDLNHTGCRLLRPTPLDAGAPVIVELPAKLAGGNKLELQCRVVRSEPSGADKHAVGVSFEDLDANAQLRLDDILQGKVIGTVVSRLGDDLSEQTASTTIPASSARQSTTDPQPEPAPEPAKPGRIERRNRRVSYAREVTALLGGGTHAIMGRDLSIEGMRADPLPELPIGTELELAIYGASGSEPVLVAAVVARDDGPQGTVFRFRNIGAGDRRQLERIIASAAEVRSLSEDEPVVLAETRSRG